MQTYPWTDCLPANFQAIQDKMLSVTRAMSTVSNTLSDIVGKVGGLSKGFASNPPNLNAPRNVLKTITSVFEPIAIPLGILDAGEGQRCPDHHPDQSGG